MTDAPTTRPSPLSAASWLAIIGAAIGILGGMALAGVFALTGITSANLPPLPSQEPPAAPTPIATASPTPSPTSSEPQPTLTSKKERVEPGERFDLTGTIPGVKEGTTLQVQVKDDGPWNDFPVNPTMRANGAFATEVYTTRTGTRSFRILDKASGKATPELKMTIG